MELFIEKYRVDVNKTFSTLITLAIDDIKDFGSKNTTFSKTIILPGTNNNNKLFGSIFETTARQDYNPLQPNVGLNFNAATSARALIFVDNIQVFKGTLRLLEIINDNGFIEYECAVFGELGGLVASIGNAKLEDLDFSAYNHTYNLTNIVASWDNASAGVGYYYPLIDYGTYSTAKKDWNYRTFRPAFFAKEYIDKIFANAGYTFDSTHLNTTRVKSWIIPHNRKDLTARNTLLLNRIANSQSINDATSTFVEYTAGTLGGFTTSDNITYNFTGTATNVNIKCFVDIISYTGFPDSITLDLRKNNIVIKTISTTIGGLFDLSINNISLSTADFIDVRISSIILGQTLTYSGTLRVDATNAQPTILLLNDNFVANDSLPQNILQKDFLSSILKLSNLYVFEDADNDKLLKIEPFIDFYANAQ
ncbi:MAG: hypothetical protein ACOVO1_13755, partial [Chitinophagaceae bacterium]